MSRNGGMDNADAYKHFGNRKFWKFEGQKRKADRQDRTEGLFSYEYYRLVLAGVATVSRVNTLECNFHSREAQHSHGRTI